MDGDLAIEHNRQGLLHILATLIAMAGARTTLPRHLRNTILRLLRPAESATRRLVIALARGLVVTLPRQRLSPARRATAPLKIVVTPLFVTDGIGTGIFLPRGVTTLSASPPPNGGSIEPVPVRRRKLHMPLIDRLPPPFAVRPTYVPPHLTPRIATPGITDLRPLPPPPSAHDPIDSRRLRLRLQALSAALSDMPKQALRFARWQARQRRARENARSAENPVAKGGWKPRPPLRRGRPPGMGRHEARDILVHANELACFALEHPDTS